MSKINPIIFSLNQGTATEIFVRPINVELYQDKCGSYYELLEVTLNEDETENKKVVATGNVDIPAEVYLNWSDDDSIIENYVIKTLGLEKDEEI